MGKMLLASLVLLATAAVLPAASSHHATGGYALCFTAPTDGINQACNLACHNLGDEICAFPGYADIDFSRSGNCQPAITNPTGTPFLGVTCVAGYRLEACADYSGEECHEEAIDMGG